MTINNGQREWLAASSTRAG